MRRRPYHSSIYALFRFLLFPSLHLPSTQKKEHTEFSCWKGSKQAVEKSNNARRPNKLFPLLPKPASQTFFPSLALFSPRLKTTERDLSQGISHASTARTFWVVFGSRHHPFKCRHMLLLRVAVMGWGGIEGVCRGSSIRDGWTDGMGRTGRNWT
jgi:hypothetical protein